MDTLSAFLMGEINRNKPERVFDWDRAAQLIRERQPSEASAGLIEDWEWTGGCIYRNSEPCLDEYTFLSSTWATPTLILDGEEISCWVPRADTEWNPNTKWPKTALRILVEQPASVGE